jgi:CBS domain-containing protein
LALRPETNGRILLQEGQSMKLKDIYRPDTVTIDLHDDLATAARRMEQAQVRALAVVDEAGQLVGIFTERDLVRATARAVNPADVLVSAHASFRPETAGVEEDSRAVARRMLELGVRHLPVTAGGDRLVGMLSMRDLLAVEAWM